MNYFKKFVGKSQQVRTGRSGVLLTVIVCSVLFFVQFLLAYDHTVNDRFYIPNDNDPNYVFNGEIGNPEWNTVNWFTFGTEGHPEVRVYGRYNNDSLFLAFHFDFDTFTSNDELIIGIDPLNSGGKTTGDDLLLYEIFPYNSVKLYSIWDYLVKDWHLENLPSFIESRIDTNLKKNYWEVEIEIACDSIMQDFGDDFFGLYFQVTDWVDSSNYFLYCWPTSAQGMNSDIPLADQWANGIFVTASTASEPDLYFHWNEKNIRTGYTSNDCIIKPGQKNFIFVKIFNLFFPGLPDGDVQQIPLQVEYRDFGLGNFVPITTSHQFSVQANSVKEVQIIWDAPPGQTNMPDTVSLRAEFTRQDDPITCNNSTRRLMQYLKVQENKSVDLAIYIENTAEQIGMDYTSTFYASNSPFPLETTFQDTFKSYNTLYLYLDRSGLDPSVPDSTWDVKFAIIGPKDTVSLSDRDSVKFGKGETKKFLLHFTAPAYQLLSSDRPISDLKIKVSKIDESFTIKNKVYNRMKTLGYCGAYIRVVRKPTIFWGFVKWTIGIISLLGAGYLVYNKVKD